MLAKTARVLGGIPGWLLPSTGLAMAAIAIFGYSSVDLSWIRDAKESGIHAMRRFASGLKRDLSAVRNALATQWSSGQVEGQVNRLKTLKRSMYGRCGIEILRARMLPCPV